MGELNIIVIIMVLLIVPCTVILVQQYSVWYNLFLTSIVPVPLLYVVQSHDHRISGRLHYMQQRMRLS